jgi:Domain of unknown function (DUF4349)
MKKSTTVAVLGVSAMLLAGCSGAVQGANEGAPRQAAGPGSQAGSGRDSGSGGGTRGESESGGNSGIGSDTPVKARPASERDIVYTADLRVRTDTVNKAADQAKQRVSAAGGHVADENAHSEPGSPATVTITFKIPTERYKPTLDQLANRLGTRLSLRQQAEDVTEQVADVDSRIRSAEETLSSYRRLLSRAGSISEVLSVEQEISQRQADLEALQARQRTLSEQTRFATVTLHLESTPAAPTKPQTGFVGGVKAGWTAFLTFISGLATLFGWLLPFLVAGVVVGTPSWRLWRFIRRRSAGRRGAKGNRPTMDARHHGLPPGGRSGTPGVPPSAPPATSGHPGTRPAGAADPSGPPAPQSGQSSMRMTSSAEPTAAGEPASRGGEPASRDDEPAGRDGEPDSSTGPDSLDAGGGPAR